MRICTRSAASRFESGSSKRKTSGFAHDGAADGDALALAAGELRRLAVEQRPELQHVGGALGALLDVGTVMPGHAQAEADVLRDRHVRIERIGLEHHGDAAVGGLHIASSRVRRSAAIPM